ncbi:hypothetical protein E4U42_000282 [Claviceps africana]|uniref:Uncharacterized protein n=1 Tax=Claviceps africana TaxID=83212 RepID=A0A8K0NHX5_9HYPO|nr:hypothetical protein E4U42_000282 [Claviceps africana]
MVTKRLRSAPTTPAPSIPWSSETTLVGASSPVLRSKTLPISPDFFSSAEKLARMTLELKLHKLVGQIDSLVSDVVQLKNKTKENDAFCRQHAGRLNRMCHETEAARRVAESCMRLRDEDRRDVGEHVRRAVQEQVQDELGNMRSVVEDLMGKVDMVPTLAEANAVLAAVRVQREACEAGAGGDTGCSRGNDRRARIEETIRSTRRWHMDHKTTTLTDAEFIAKYLRKQSKRDPAMAAYLQRAIWKRVRARVPEDDGGRARPQSLGEFCRHVVWEDVKRAVEDVLVRRVYGAGESLSQVQM